MHYRGEYDKAVAIVLASRERTYRPQVDVIPATKPYPGWVTSLAVILMFWLLFKLLHYHY